jgi:hypothetical protein
VVEWKNGRVVNHSTTRLISYSTNPLLVIEYWNLGFICNLMLGIWNFISSTGERDD